MIFDLSAPLVSIIIPCWNAEQYIGEAIESALAQTYKNTEVIIIDDGSTDRSPNIIQSFGNRVHWETGSNNGACVARNRGLELAKGEIIQFLDADDLLAPEKLEFQIPILVKNKNALVFCNWVGLSSIGSEKTMTFHPPLDWRDSVSLAVNYIIGIETPLHWRANLEKINGFRNHLPCCQDYDLHLRLACDGISFKHLDMELVKVRKRQGSISSDMHRLFAVWSDVLLYAYNMLEQNNGVNDYRAEMIAGRMASLGRQLLGLRDTEKARQCFSRAKQIHVSGGIYRAYDRKSRLLRSVVGPRLAEKLIGVYRELNAHRCSR